MIDDTATRFGSEHRPSQGLQISLAVEGPCLVVSLTGDVDAANIDGLPAVVFGALNGDESVRVDIGDVSFLDSSLLRSLLICQARLEIDGIDLKVRNAGEQARRIFEMTNLTSLLE